VAENRAETVRSALDAYNSGDLETLGSFLADDILWHVGGDHPLSGDYQGRDSVLAYCARTLELTNGTLRGEPVEILVGDHHAGIFNRIRGERDGRTLDVVLAQAVTFDTNGRWTEYWALADQQDDVDAFWTDPL